MYFDVPQWVFFYIKVILKLYENRIWKLYEFGTRFHIKFILKLYENYDKYQFRIGLIYLFCSKII